MLAVITLGANELLSGKQYWYSNLHSWVLLKVYRVRRQVGRTERTERTRSTMYALFFS